MEPTTTIILLVLLAFSHTGTCLTCLDGWSFNNNQTIDHHTECNVKETWCFQLNTHDKDHLVFKSCWDPNWEDQRYNEEGCIIGQHCLMGLCYENATACLCNDFDNCNDFDPSNNETHSTPMPYPPTTPSELHECYYGVKDKDQVSSLEQVEQCLEGEQLCVVVTEVKDEYEYRSCWSGWNIEYSRPGCYEGFQHCHHGHCHNDTIICVCAENKCNDEHYSSVAPPQTPGSGLYCFQGEGNHHGDNPVACKSNENYCLYIGSNDHNFEKRDCWDPTYMEGIYNFTGCESGMHCIFGDCHNSTVCICKGDLCNGVELNNGTTASPWPVTTAQDALKCWYGEQNATSKEDWQHQTCLPEEIKCVTFWTDDKGILAGCYDPKWDDNKYSENQCYDEGQICRENHCYNATICVCEEENCNDPLQTTEKPIETTPGSGLHCWYGMKGMHHQNDTDLTKQICNRNQTLCLFFDNKENGFSYRTCHDPNDNGGMYPDADECYKGLHCWTWDNEGHQDCSNGTLCTCNTDYCNAENSTTPAPVTRTTNKDSHQCWFGEQHPGMTETWEVETCTSDQPYCFQLITEDRKFESRECWNLDYEEHEYHGPGCYRGRHCHHEHCYDDVTVCICEGSLCNDWSQNGTVTTEVPITHGSGLLCYEGEYYNSKADTDHAIFSPHFCSKKETMCSYFQETGGNGWVAAACYNVADNNGQYDTKGCYNGVTLEHGSEAPTGRFCLCGGANDGSDDLCNGDYMNGGHQASTSTFFTMAALMLTVFVYKM